MERTSESSPNLVVSCANGMASGLPVGVIIGKRCLFHAPFCRAGRRSRLKKAKTTRSFLFLSLTPIPSWPSSPSRTRGSRKSTRLRSSSTRLVLKRPTKMSFRGGHLGWLATILFERFHRPELTRTCGGNALLVMRLPSRSLTRLGSVSTGNARRTSHCLTAVSCLI